MLQHGIFLVSRWKGEGSANLFHLSDEKKYFFAEAGIDEAQDELVEFSRMTVSVT